MQTLVKKIRVIKIMQIQRNGEVNFASGVSNKCGTKRDKTEVPLKYVVDSNDRANMDNSSSTGMKNKAIE